jgi:hypothetical protein
MGSVAQIIYGFGGHLGNFEVFARSLSIDLIPRFGRPNIVMKHITRRDAFFDYLANPPFSHKDEISELHVFSHSIGAGVFIGYGDRSVDDIRELAYESARGAKRRISYEEVVNAEVGAILTDDFVRVRYLRVRDLIRSRFSPSATIKIWGCNSGVRRWIYGDGEGITDPTDSSVGYYWRALNERNVPKPAVAQAFADYFDRTCYGAGSGSHCEVFSGGHWETTGRYRSEMGRWPSGALLHRLQPDRGRYNAFIPARR